MSQFDAEPMDLAPPASRTSVLAVTSLVLSLICCIPGLGAIGTLLGVGAMVAISRSAGRVRGMGLAIAGIVLGLLFTLGWIALAVGLTITFQGVASYSDMLAAVQANDRQTVDTWLTPGAQAALNDEDLTGFRDAYTADYGEFVGVPSSLGGILAGYMAVGQQIQPAQLDAESAGYNRNEAIPVAATFDSGPGLVIVVPDQSGQTAPGGMMPAVRNIAFVAHDGSLVWLLEPPSGAP
jgi:hypothetical protein